MLLRPLPYPDAERLVFVAEHEGSGIAWPNYDDWRQPRSVVRRPRRLAGRRGDCDGRALPRRLDSRSVTANFFGVLGATPVQGRLFDESDARPDAASTAVLSHASALREFGSAPAAIGQTVSLNRQTYSVIGVLPPGFRYMTAADVYLLLEPQVAANYRGMQSRGNHTTFFAVGRLKPGVPVTSARAEMQNISAALALEHPETNKGGGVLRCPARRPRRPRHGAHADRARRSRGAAAAHRQREFRQSALEQERITRTRVRPSRRHRRHPMASDSPAARRACPARRRGWCARRARRRCDPQRSRQPRSAAIPRASTRSASTSQCWHPPRCSAVHVRLCSVSCPR